MHEDLDLVPEPLSHFSNLSERKLSPEHNSRHTLLLCKARTFCRSNAHLGAPVDLEVGSDGANELDRPGVLNDDGIHAAARYLFDHAFKVFQFGVEDENIDGDVALV